MSSSKSSSSSMYLNRIHCSDQPLDMTFHPTIDHIMVAGLVDGTVEVHDIRRETGGDQSKTTSKKKKKTKQDDDSSSDDDDEDDDNPDKEDDDIDDSILASLTICDNNHSNTTTDPSGSRTAGSVKTTQFTQDSSTIVVSTSDGRLFGLDAERSCQFTTNQSPSFLWTVDNSLGSKKKEKNNINTSSKTTTATTTSSNCPPIVSVHPMDGSMSNLLVTGDDDGCVKIWDRRLMGNRNGTSDKSGGCVRSWHYHTDYISGIDYASQYDSNTFVTSSADGRLGVYDMRMSTDIMNNDDNSNSNHHTVNDKNKKQKNGLLLDQTYRLSDDQDDELLSVKIIKNGTKVVCGTGLGVLQVFSWGVWGDCSDRFPGHPTSVDALLKVDESCLVTGSSDGVMRVVQIQPDKLLGIVGNDDHGGFPIETLAYNSNRHVVGSVSHDPIIRLWDARILLDDEDDDEDDEDDNNDDSDDDRKPSAKMPAAAAATATESTGTGHRSEDGSEDEWEDEDNDDEEEEDDDDDDDDDGGGDSDDDDDSDDEESTGAKHRGRKRLKTANEKFFEDL